MVEYINPGCVNYPLLDAGDSEFDVKTTVIFFPYLEMKYIENDDFVCGFFNDEFEKPFLVDGVTKMIRPNRIAIALDTSSKGIHDLLFQDQVGSSKQNKYNHDS